MIQTINISLIPSDNKPVINVSQYDNVLRVLRFNVFDDVEMEVPHVFDDTETVLLNIRKNDNNIVVITGEIVTETDPETEEVTEQYLTFELTEQACACVGSNYGEVSITNGDDEVIGSCNFKLVVERSPLAGGVDSQSEIDNLTTQIESITEQVIGENYYDKEEIDGKFDNLDIPTKTSELTNDSNFITANDIPTIPTKTSQLTNDSGFITANDIPTIPTKTSQLTNDSGFTTIDDDAIVNDKTWSSEKISDDLYALLPVGTATGSVSSFNTALAVHLVSCVVDENATMLYVRSNLYNKTNAEIGTISSSTGNNANANNRVRCDYFRVKNGATVYYNTNVATSRIYAFYEYDKDKTFLKYAYVADASGSYVVGENCSFLRLVFSTTLSEISVSYFDNVCINASPNTDFVPYSVLSADYNISDINDINTLVGLNNFFTDYGDITVQYKDTIQNYIDTRVNAVSSRSLSMMRTIANQVADERTIDSIEGVDRR